MSRIYNDVSLKNLPLETRHVKTWSTTELESNGDGVLLEGIVRGKSHYMIIDERGTKSRYFVYHVSVVRTHRRKFDASGTEITPNFSQTKKVSTGYLMSSYKKIPKGNTDVLDNTTLRNLIHSDLLVGNTKMHNTNGSISFWIDESQIEQLEIDIGNEVRLKTKGNSPIIEQLCRVESASKTVGNFAGDEAVGSSWTDKVLANKSEEDFNQNEGVDEDEWDD